MEKDINLLFATLSPSFTVTVLTYSLILGIIATNGAIALSKYPIKYLELVFALTNFEITVLSTLTSQIFKDFSEAKNFSLATYVFPNLSVIIL